MNLRLLSSKLQKKTIGAIVLAAAIIIGNPINADAKLGDRTLKPGMKHGEVKELQAALKKTGHFTYPKLTNHYGTYTQAAVKKFQRHTKLKQTGIADQKTINLIKQKAAKAKPKKAAPKPAAKVAPGKFNPDVAKKLLGIRYRTGGASPSTGFDCSGYTTYVMKKHNKSLPRTSSSQYGVGKAVGFKNLMPGDLLFYDTNSNGRRDISHVAIYIGNNTMIHSASVKVEYDSLSNSWWSKRYVGAKRIF
ncbi:NlpC/P60 family protein [Fictibacillus aquaticus]|uniref:NlpC/P60 domain-containing protein n=1 Tax=Fictibacillus aquaticus TaxID=2021314 RepID=A0A235F9U3_9BACL|nr:NlpC/P60 family protein [Fictibacillus aquaticus]OYD57727.1 hypothetical protein CGZ90_13790 [Fictibacillus aquaticus]